MLIISEAKTSRVDSYTWVRERREVLTENNGRTGKSNRYEIFWYWKWMKELSKDDLSHTKTFSIAEKSTIFADTQFACTQPSKNITTLFDWSVRMENSYEIKHKKIRSRRRRCRRRRPHTKWRNFWHFMSICVCTNCAMLSFYKWNLLEKSCNSNESRIFFPLWARRASQARLFHFRYLFAKMYYFMIILTWRKSKENFPKYIGTEIQSCVMLLFYPRLRRAVFVCRHEIEMNISVSARDTIVKSNANKLARTWMLCLRLCYGIRSR